MARIAIADESGIQQGNKCYGIGAILLERSALAHASAQISDLLRNANIRHELKWSDTPSRAHIEAICAGVLVLLTGGCSFHAIIVEKATYRNYRVDKETAFYQTYQLLASHIARYSGDPFELWIDSRSDEYPKRTEVVQKITNYVTTRRGGTADLIDVRMVDSKEHVLLQMVDVVLGAITADTHRYLGGTSVTSPGKLELINRLASLIGWDRLAYDTYPNADFNVWHFPPEFRARPKTRRIVLPPARSLANAS